MTGTETLGSGGGVTGGSDSFTWWQNASDVLTMVEDGGGTSGVYTQYQLTLYDQISQDFADNGTDILGASDSIVAGSDTYTMDTDRNLATTIIDNGTSSSPYYINAYGWDDLGQHDQGASTLTTNGHVYATDTLTYGEDTGDNATDSQSSATTGENWLCNGSAYDYCINNDTTTQTVSDTSTTTHDSFGVMDTHAIGGTYVLVENTSLMSLSVQDTDNDSSTFVASGTKSSAGDSYSFSAVDAQGDDMALAENMSNTYAFSAMNDATQLSTSYGSEWLNGSTQSFSYLETTTSDDVMSDSGVSTYYVVGNGTTIAYYDPFVETDTTTMSAAYAVTGPPLSNATVGWLDNHTVNGSTPSAIPLQSLVEAYAGSGFSTVEMTAEYAGGSKPNTAEHPGTSPNWLARCVLCTSWQESHLVAEFVRIPRWIACDLSASGPLGSVWLAEFSRILLRGKSDKVAGPLCSLRFVAGISSGSGIRENSAVDRLRLVGIRSAWLRLACRILTNSATWGESDKVAGPLCSLPSWQESHLVAEFVRIPRWIACDLSASGPLGSAWLAEFSRILLRGERVIRWLARCVLCISWQESHLVAEFVRIPRWIACDLSASGPLGSAWLAEFSRILLRGEE